MRSGGRIPAYCSSGVILKSFFLMYCGVSMYESRVDIKDNSRVWFIAGLSGYTMISFILKMAAALPVSPIFAVFSLRCGVSEMIDAGMAILMILFDIFVEPASCLLVAAFSLNVNLEI